MEESKKNLPASVHQRLLNLARTENRPLNELLQYYAIERFLFRLGELPLRNQFVLKGAQMLRAWTNSPLTARPTMDVDLLGKVVNGIENLEKIFDVAVSWKSKTALRSTRKRCAAKLIRKDVEYKGVRVFVKGFLGKIRLNVQIDFGFGDAVVPAPIEIVLPQLLDLGSPQLFGYTPESAIAEKFQAMVALDITNTRYKDFYDISFLSQNLEFDGAVLAAAIETTFRMRQTSLPEKTPNALTKRFTADENKRKQWQAFVRKNRLDDLISLEETARQIEIFLMPVVESLNKGESFTKHWSFAGGWNS